MRTRIEAQKVWNVEKNQKKTFFLLQNMKIDVIFKAKKVSSVKLTILDGIAHEKKNSMDKRTTQRRYHDVMSSNMYWFSFFLRLKSSKELRAQNVEKHKIKCF